MAESRARAAVFVDGNNMWHALKRQKVANLGQLNYAKVSRKLILDREWIGARYYVGQVKNLGDGSLYNSQRKYLAFLAACDPLISVHLGRIETQTVENKTASALKRYLADLRTPIDPAVYHELVRIGNSTEKPVTFHEKAVDVALAVDLVMMAHRDEFDVAFLLSADGDFTPAVKAARDLGKRVFAASPAYGAQLAASATKYIPMAPSWFEDCFGP